MEREKPLSPHAHMPTPDDFEAYLPFACSQLQVPADIIVRRTQRGEYVSARHEAKRKRKQSIIPAVTDTSLRGSEWKPFGNEAEKTENVIKIEAVYSGEHLVQVNFDKNKNIPSILIKILGLILQYHINVHCINVNSGLNQNSLYELSKLIPAYNITDICLDDTFLREANYHVLLDNPSHLKQLSLRRCKINDLVLETIASKLAYPNPASETLSILNLSTNRITDDGAKYLAKALRSNRQLSYLNLSCNMISDIGAEEILNVLKRFPLSREEILESRTRLIKFLKDKYIMIHQLLLEYKAEYKKMIEDLKNKTVKTIATTTVKKGKGLKKVDPVNNGYAKDSFANSEQVFLRKAEIAAQKCFGNFKDPFSYTNTETKDGVRFSFGNNTLCYLNLAYNNLSYLTLKTLFSVLVAQNQNSRTPRGLINVSIEGNPLPVECEKLNEIDAFLRSGLSSLVKNPNKRITSCN